MSEQMPEITAEEAQVLEELDQMRQDDPEGYAAMIADPVEADPEKAHAEWILETLTGASKRQQEDSVMDLLNQAWASSAESSAEASAEAERHQQ